DEKVRLEESKRQRREEHGEEDVEHPALRVLGADLDHLLAVFDRCLLDTLKLYVGLDELDSTVRAGGHGLHRSACEPVDDCASSDQAEEKRRVQQREFVEVPCEPVGQQEDDRE